MNEMSDINEHVFKSLDNSKNINKKDWIILSLSIKKINEYDVKLGCHYCLVREVAYIDEMNKVYQIGRLYVPINSFDHVLFFLKLFFSRKTFGHYISENFKSNYKIQVIESRLYDNYLNLLFAENCKVNISKRIVLIPMKKYKFYVEEELEVIESV